jgi:hypothetical protein
VLFLLILSAFLWSIFNYELSFVMFLSILCLWVALCFSLFSIIRTTRGLIPLSVNYLQDFLKVIHSLIYLFNWDVLISEYLFSIAQLLLTTFTRYCISIRGILSLRPRCVYPHGHELSTIRRKGSFFLIPSSLFGFSVYFQDYFLLSGLFNCNLFWSFSVFLKTVKIYFYFLCFMIKVLLISFTGWVNTRA